MTHSTHSSHPVRLFPLTDYGLVRISRAIQSSIRFMKKYGQGRQPRAIHSENYINSYPGLFQSHQ